MGRLEYIEAQSSFGPALLSGGREVRGCNISHARIGGQLSTCVVIPVIRPGVYEGGNTWFYTKLLPNPRLDAPCSSANVIGRPAGNACASAFSSKECWTQIRPVLARLAPF